MEANNEKPEFKGSFTEDIKAACEKLNIDVPSDINYSIYNYSMSESG